MAGMGAPMVDIETLHATVTRLADTVGRLTTDVSGLMSTHDGGVYGEDYAADGGPAVRARFFENAIDQDRRRIAELTEQVTQLEASMAGIASIQTHYNEGVDKMMTGVTRLEGKQEEQEEKAKDLMA